MYILITSSYISYLILYIFHNNHFFILKLNCDFFQELKNDNITKIIVSTNQCCNYQLNNPAIFILSNLHARYLSLSILTH